MRSLEHIERRRFAHPDNHAGLALEDMGTPAGDLHNLRSKIASYLVDAERGWAYASGLRNSTGFDWHPDTGALHASNNGPNHWGFEFPPEYCSRLMPGSATCW